MKGGGGWLKWLASDWCSEGLFFGTLTVVFFHVFPQSSQLNYGLVPEIKIRPLSYILHPIHYSLHIRAFHSIT